MQWVNKDKRWWIAKSHPAARITIYKNRKLWGQSYTLWFCGRRVSPNYSTLYAAQSAARRLCDEVASAFLDMIEENNDEGK